MHFIDTHSHLYLAEFNQDIELVIERALKAGVKKIFLPSINNEVVKDMLNLEEKYPTLFVPMIGLHPCSVGADAEEELKQVEKWLEERKFVAVGEIGLDFYWDTTFKNEQEAAFDRQMELALHYNIPIVIHTRNAMEQTIKKVKPFAQRGLTGIFHCFGDSGEMAQQIIDLGFYLGIGGVVTYKKANLGEALKDVPLEKMVLETDAPYLTPAPFRGKRNESSYLTYIAAKLADIKNCRIEEVAAITTANAEKIFGN